VLDLESLQDALLDILTNVLGTALEHFETTEAWMNDPIFKDYVLLHKQAIKQHNRRRTEATATARNQALKKPRWAKHQAITKARLATLKRIAQRDPTALFRDLKQRREPRTATTCPHLNRATTTAAWSNILQRPATQQGIAAGDMPPLTDHINLTFEITNDNDEVLAAISRTKNKSSGPDGLDARGVKVLAPVLYPLYQITFNSPTKLAAPSPQARADRPHRQGQDLHGPPQVPSNHHPTHTDPHIPFYDRLQAPRAHLRPWHHQRESSRLHAPEKHAPPSHDLVLHHGPSPPTTLHYTRGLPGP